MFFFQNISDISLSSIIGNSNPYMWSGSKSKGEDERSLLVSKDSDKQERLSETDIYKICVHTFSWSPWADQWAGRRSSVHSREFYCQWFVDASSVHKKYLHIYYYLY